MLPDMDLSKLSPEHLAIACAWVEDRFLNAVTPLGVRLQMEPPGMMAADKTLQVAQRAVAHVLEHVDEIRAIARGQGSEVRGQGSGVRGQRGPA